MTKTGDSVSNVFSWLPIYFLLHRFLILKPYPYSTVTLFARFRGWSTSAPRRTAMW
jgi:hypothetical protein